MQTWATIWAQIKWALWTRTYNWATRQVMGLPFFSFVFKIYSTFLNLKNHKKL